MPPYSKVRKSLPRARKQLTGWRVCAGLMTQITEDQKYGMIEAISHLIHRDYEAIVEDFVLLDFIPRGVSPRNQCLAAA
jgi:predicted unusual protein kinase regulating ubiquinone biosynthesis (AarF/ABC1/UbiB family)